MERCAEVKAISVPEWENFAEIGKTRPELGAHASIETSYR
jgi:hypothetical protein